MSAATRRPIPWTTMLLLLGASILLLGASCPGGAPQLPPVYLCADGRISPVPCPPVTPPPPVPTPPAPTPSPDPPPSPAPTPTPPPAPIPSPSPSPSPSPVPTPPPPPPPPTEPCFITPPPYPPECWKCGDKIAWEVMRNNWHPIPGNLGYYMEHDHTTMGAWFPGWVPSPADVAKISRALNSVCQMVTWPSRNKLHDPEDGWFGNVCHRQEPRPCPPQEPPPPPPPPGGPGTPRNDVRPSCPPFSAVHTHVLNTMNSAFQPVSSPVAGGYVVIDATPLYDCPGGCFSRNRCNNEFHDVCTISGLGNHRNNDSEHLASVAGDRACTNYRQCEDPRGICWRYSGPSVETRIQTPGPHRGFQIRLGPLRSGHYEVTGYGGGDCSQQDAQGGAVPGSGVGAVTFVVP